MRYCYMKYILMRWQTFQVSQTLRHLLHTSRRLIFDKIMLDPRLPRFFHYIRNAYIAGTHDHTPFYIGTAILIAFSAGLAVFKVHE